MAIKKFNKRKGDGNHVFTQIIILSTNKFKLIVMLKHIMIYKLEQSYWLSNWNTFYMSFSIC